MRIINVKFTLDCAEKYCYKCKFMKENKRKMYERDCYCDLYKQELSGWNEQNIPRLKECMGDDIGKEIKC